MTSFEATKIELRKQLIESDFSVLKLLKYGRALVENNQGRSAEEFFALALERDPSNLEALEMYIMVHQEFNLANNNLTHIISRFSENIVKYPSRQFAALDYLIPFKQNEALTALSKSKNQKIRVTAQLNELLRLKSPIEYNQIFNGMNAQEQAEIRLKVALARGNRVESENLIAQIEPANLPVDSLRRSARRAIKSNKTKFAKTALNGYAQARPQDNWVKNQLKKVSSDELSNYQLGKKGFPFPAKVLETAFEPLPNKVFYLLHNSLPYHSAGYATRTHGLLNELNRAGWDVDGVTRLGYPYDMPGKESLPNIPRKDIVDNVDYLRLINGREIEKKNPLFSYTERYSQALMQLAKIEKPSIIHAASNHWNGLTAVKAANKLGLPSIYEVRGLWEVTRGSRNPEWAKGNMFQFMARMEADAAKGATAVLAITNALKQEMIHRGVAEEKISIIPNGVDTQRFVPIPRDESLAESLGVQNKTVIGYVGSVLDYEGIELLLESANDMSSKRNDFHVLIVGDGAELERFKLFVREMNLDDVVTFTGRVPHEEVERYYSLVDIAPFPRLPLPVCEMVSPLKPFEAMAMGKAVIASNVAALEEIVTPGLNGLLHKKGSYKDLQDKIEYLMDNPEEMKLLGNQARKWVVEKRDWKVLAQTISDLYTRILS